MLWTIALAGGAVAILFNNILFGLLIIISAFTISIYAARKPKIVTFNVSRKGVKAGDILLPFSNLSHFSIAEGEGLTYLLLQSKKVFSPLYSFPISPEVDLDELSDFLNQFLEEGNLEVPFHQKIMDKVGF
ncbi:MAG: hypothetical protein U5L75_02955 [Candidatus Campbellbacteria bacterium]|nr:hypothetical protein [Candidatus Campbellbacteria bacterium]